MVGTGNFIGVPGDSVGNVGNAKAFDRINASNRGVSFRCSFMPIGLIVEGIIAPGGTIRTVLPIELPPPKKGNAVPVVLTAGVGGGRMDDRNTCLKTSLPDMTLVASSCASVAGVYVDPMGPFNTKSSALYFLRRLTNVEVRDGEVVTSVGDARAIFIVRVSEKQAS